MKKLLFTVTALLFLLCAVSALADPDSPPLDEQEQTRRELAYLQKFDIFPSVSPIPFEKLVTLWLNEGMAKRIDDRVAYELCRNNVADETTIRDALAKARTSCPDAKDSFPKTMVTYLLKALNSPRLPPTSDTLEETIVHAVPEAESRNPVRTTPGWAVLANTANCAKWAPQSSIRSFRPEENTVHVVPQAKLLNYARSMSTMPSWDETIARAVPEAKSTETIARAVPEAKSTKSGGSAQSSGKSEEIIVHAVPEAEVLPPHSPDPLEAIIVDAVSKAKEEIEAENEQLREEFGFYDEIEEIDLMLGSLLSRKEARDTKMFKIAVLDVAQLLLRKDQENEKSRRPLFYDEEKQRKQLLGEEFYRRTILEDDIQRARKEIKLTLINDEFDKLRIDKLFTELNEDERLKKKISLTEL